MKIVNPAHAVYDRVQAIASNRTPEEIDAEIANVLLTVWRQPELVNWPTYKGRPIVTVAHMARLLVWPYTPQKVAASLARLEAAGGLIGAGKYFNRRARILMHLTLQAWVDDHGYIATWRQAQTPQAASQATMAPELVAELVAGNYWTAQPGIDLDPDPETPPPTIGDAKEYAEEFSTAGGQAWLNTARQNDECNAFVRQARRFLDQADSRPAHSDDRCEAGGNKDDDAAMAQTAQRLAVAVVDAYEAEAAGMAHMADLVSLVGSAEAARLITAEQSARPDVILVGGPDGTRPALAMAGRRRPVAHLLAEIVCHDQTDVALAQTLAAVINEAEHCIFTVGMLTPHLSLGLIVALVANLRRNAGDPVVQQLGAALSEEYLQRLARPVATT